MKAAFIVMSILGCDDAGVHCTPVASVAQEWRTISSCDASSEKILSTYSYVKKPMVVAVCQTADTTALADSQADIAETSAMPPPVPPVPPMAHKDDKQGVMNRALAIFKHAIPSGNSIRTTLTKPVHFVTDTYSWVARKVVD